VHNWLASLTWGQRVRRYVSGGRSEAASRRGGDGGGSGGGGGGGGGSDSDDDEGRPLIRDHYFRDPQLVEINQKIEELTKRNNFLEGTASGLQDLLNASKKREKDHLQQVCTALRCAVCHLAIGTAV
jgi:hypothetical protein